VLSHLLLREVVCTVQAVNSDKVSTVASCGVCRTYVDVYVVAAKLGSLEH